MQCLWGMCSGMQAELMAVMHRLARHMDQQLAARSCSRLLGYTQQLAAAVGSDLLGSSLAAKILPEHVAPSPPAGLAVALHVVEGGRVILKLTQQQGGSTAAASAVQSAGPVDPARLSDEAIIADICQSLVQAVCGGEATAASPDPASGVQLRHCLSRAPSEVPAPSAGALSHADSCSGPADLLPNAANGLSAPALRAR